MTWTENPVWRYRDFEIIRHGQYPDYWYRISIVADDGSFTTIRGDYRTLAEATARVNLTVNDFMRDFS